MKLRAASCGVSIRNIVSLIPLTCLSHQGREIRGIPTAVLSRIPALLQQATGNKPVEQIGYPDKREKRRIDRK